ncbi:TPA: hypothetical protein L9S60_005248 [Klebsiella pneumoniae]|uniref:hypothetical protein n=1 Tax=Klebsiella quasipneumoniae TaxID=1463165 RepID=UPI00299595FE|nr:hypothetical protein [Klebsiella quasipneumoniae]HBR3485227.1 hypothetical protein [Klebsiella pneumoniae]
MGWQKCSGIRRSYLATLTVRHLPAEVDAAITTQAKAAGKSKSDFIQAFLSASFGDLIGNFSRTSELVALMDRELSRVTGLPLTDNWYDAGHTLTENREYCRLLGIGSEGDMQRIMMTAVPWLTLRVQQLDTGKSGIPLLPQGVSLTCALFIEAAGRERPQLAVFRRHLFWYQDEAQFWQEVDALRAARLLPALAHPDF